MGLGYVDVETPNSTSQKHVQRVHDDAANGRGPVDAGPVDGAGPVLVVGGVEVDGVAVEVDRDAWADDDANVVEVEPLDRVHAAHLVDGVVPLTPGNLVARGELVPGQLEPAGTGHVPFLVAADSVRIVVGGEDPALAILPVLVDDPLVHLLAVGKHLELKPTPGAGPLLWQRQDLVLEAEAVHPLENVGVVVGAVRQLHAELLLQLKLPPLLARALQNPAQREGAAVSLLPILVRPESLLVVVDNHGSLARPQNLRQMVLSEKLLVCVLA